MTPTDFLHTLNDALQGDASPTAAEEKQLVLLAAERERLTDLAIRRLNIAMMPRPGVSEDELRRLASISIQLALNEYAIVVCDSLGDGT